MDYAIQASSPTKDTFESGHRALFANTPTPKNKSASGKEYFYLTAQWAAMEISIDRFEKRRNPISKLDEKSV